ncbi:Lar family restriction alleviation protein [Pseudoalteromonas sp. Of11M-6]|uniref:Lar family restriction alleviation protein n=1 Tax=Pseudoalteromonas sp. Of11M-6 TaxID=2917754 RepID=UPI001EF6B320|nr:Lar family restriction alleviation protein [Pseudoalteromonas sp. Of11M-6]MCG7552092.1 Lar family restriction alleviation protein [Pseudoalteromonas sp. Of11M-6]
MNLKPCPFCNSVPSLPTGDGTQYEIWCDDCGKAVVSVQICDLMTHEEKLTDDFINYRYQEIYIDRAKEEAIKRWNKRFN